MRLGIGGGAFGIRGGISTRGIGVGAGPLSAGTSWGGRRRRSSSGGGGFFIFLIAILALAWPWFLGTYIAVAAGASNPSPARTITGVIFELPWVVVLIYAGISASRKHSERAAHLAAYHAVRPTAGASGQAVYHHGGCTINHRTPAAAGRCRKG
jgi:hypothetical protein